MCRIITRLLPSVLLFAAAIAAPSASWGEWSFVPPPTVGERADVFAAVDGIAADDIWAVGAWEPPDWNSRCLIEHFDGVAWTKLPVPAVGSGEKLLGVLAASRDRALAVGYYVPYASTAQPLAMEWNGTEWAQLSVPQFPGGRKFEAIDQTPSGEIWVAGQQAGSAFIARRSDGGWSFENAPPVEGGGSFFNAIHAAADNQIWVVGNTDDESGSFRILIQRYDGNSSWTTFNVPTPGLEFDQLAGVHAFAPDDVWAVGEYYHAERFNTQPLIMHYDGTTWTQIELPDYPEGPAMLRGMAARAPDDIYAAGTYGLGPSSSLPRPFMLHYDGASWSDVILPPTGGLAEWFVGMAATPDGDIWAVGQYSDGSTMEPMAFRNAPATTAVGGPPRGPSMALRSVPNPFQSRTSVHLTLDHPGSVRLRVLDLSGRVVRVLVQSELEAGPHVVPWDGLDSSGQSVPAGIYFYEFNAGAQAGRERAIRVR